MPTSPATVSPPIKAMPRLAKPWANALRIRTRVSSDQFLLRHRPRMAMRGIPPIAEMSDTFETMCFSTACSGVAQSSLKCVFSTERSLVTSHPSKMAQSSPAPSQEREDGGSCLNSAASCNRESIKLNSGTSGNIFNKIGIYLAMKSLNYKSIALVWHGYQNNALDGE